MTKMATIPENYNKIRAGIVELLKTARSSAARNVNTLMTATYWEIGRRIVQSEQAGEKRAEYGELLIKRLAKDLSASFGRGFGPRNLAQMRSFYLAWSHGKILQTLSAKSSTPLPFNEIQRQPQPVQDLANQFPLPWSAYVRLHSRISDAILKNSHHDHRRALLMDFLRKSFGIEVDEVELEKKIKVAEARGRIGFPEAGLMRPFQGPRPSSVSRRMQYSKYDASTLSRWLTGLSSHGSENGSGSVVFILRP